MEPNNNKCPNCQAELTNGFFTSNDLVSLSFSKKINEFTDNKAERHCEKCYKQLYAEVSDRRKDLESKKVTLKTSIANEIYNIPIVTTHSPYNWDYIAARIVTGQSTTGTGVFSEITSSFTDFFGTQSGSFNNKLKNGENLCFSQLRFEAASLNCNAIIATDLDYSDVGAGKGMLMVCASGTAVYLNNFEQLYGSDHFNKVNELLRAVKELREINNRLP